jgi:hypothetical protein
MLGGTVTNNIEQVCKSFVTGRRVVFDPKPIQKALTLSPQAKVKQARNIAMFLNSPRYKNLMKQLQKEFDISLTK